MTGQQTVIPGVTPPPRPLRAPCVKEAAEKFADDFGLNAAIADDLVSAWAPYMGGYELAKALDDDHDWDIDAMMVERLDSFDSFVDRVHEAKCWAWVREWDVKPSLAVGTVIDKGVIAGVSEHSPACYMVKEKGCTQDGRFLLVKFEDAGAQVAQR